MKNSLNDEKLAFTADDKRTIEDECKTCIEWLESNAKLETEELKDK